VFIGCPINNFCAIGIIKVKFNGEIGIRWVYSGWYKGGWICGDIKEWKEEEFKTRVEDKIDEYVEYE
jgi:hypothetical protein